MGATRVIEREAEEVFAFVSDASNDPRWQTDTVSCEWTSSPPIEVGSTCSQHGRFMGQDGEFDFEVTELDPGHSITFELRGGSLPITVTRTVQSLGEGRCQVTVLAADGPDQVESVSDPAEQEAQDSVDADYDRLKKLLEAERSKEAIDG